MKINKYFLMLMVFCGSLFHFGVSYADGTSAWHAMPQWQKNQAILSRAYEDLNLNVGVECKDWVRAVIRDVSQSYGHNPAINIPSTNPAPNDYYWVNDYSGNFTMGSNYPIEYVQEGWVIQMRLAGGSPHTAIVMANNGYWVTFIDSNWYYNTAPTTVKVHYMTYEEFYSKLAFRQAYSVYIF